MRFAEKRKWIDDNPATELKAPKVPNKPTMPFTREEMIRIFAALEPYGKSAGIRNAQRLRAFVLLLRYSGLRIGDATQLEVGRLHGNKVLLHTQKTGVPVYCVLPDVTIKKHRVLGPSAGRAIGSIEDFNQHIQSLMEITPSLPFSFTFFASVWIVWLGPIRSNRKKRFRT